jgi:Tol biopolymer transport system component
VVKAILESVRVRALSVGAVVIAAAAVCLMVQAQPAAGAFPGANGVIVAARCDDGLGCAAQHLWTVHARSGARVQLTSGPDRDDDPSFSPDGRRIVFSRCPIAGHCRIATVTVGGANETDLTPAPLTGHDESPSFSSDGSRIVFTRTERGGRHLFVTDANGRDVTRLTTGRVQDRGAVYSPDGSSIVFERYETGVGFRIFEIAARGGTPSPLTSGPGDYSPSVSPDGARIVFARRAGTGSAIWIMRADGRSERALTGQRAGSSDAHPAFSPDGRQIVFNRLHSTQPVGEQLMVMAATGRGERAITPASEFFYNADWQRTAVNGASRSTFPRDGGDAMDSLRSAVRLDPRLS